MAKDARIGARVPRDGTDARKLESLRAEIKQELSDLNREIERATGPEPAQVSNEERLLSTLSDQHPIHGIVGEVFMDKGGKEYMRDWADRNENRFMSQVFKSIPTVNPISGRTGDLVIRIETSLGRTALDDDNIISVQ